jgi:retron-type reverse transcriptase
MSNYRPISLLTTLSKVFENVMYNRLSHYLKTNNNILVPEQFGFRKGMSTENAAFELTDCILKYVNQKMHVGGIFCDLAKAFDCVNHEILLTKLRYYGIEGTTAGWFKSYLTEIKSPYTTQSIYSNWGTIEHGVPQGSILGPLLFIIYI